jgi:hypothetical protein
MRIRIIFLSLMARMADDAQLLLEQGGACTGSPSVPDTASDGQTPGSIAGRLSYPALSRAGGGEAVRGGVGQCDDGARGLRQLGQPGGASAAGWQRGCRSWFRRGGGARPGERVRGGCASARRQQRTEGNGPTGRGGARAGSIVGWSRSHCGPAAGAIAEPEPLRARAVGWSHCGPAALPGSIAGRIPKAMVRRADLHHRRPCRQGGGATGERVIAALDWYAEWRGRHIG